MTWIEVITCSRWQDRPASLGDIVVERRASVFCCIVSIVDTYYRDKLAGIGERIQQKAR